MITGQEDPMLSTKSFSCGSCFKPIYKIDGLKAPHNAWKNAAATTIYKMEQDNKSYAMPVPSHPSTNAKQTRPSSATNLGHTRTESDLETINTQGTIYNHPTRKKITISPKMRKEVSSDNFTQKGYWVGAQTERGQHKRSRSNLKKARPGTG